MTDTFFDKIEKYSKSLGFQDIKVTNFSDFNIYSKHLREFIKNKFYGEMNWIKEKVLPRFKAFVNRENNEESLWRQN